MICHESKRQMKISCFYQILVESRYQMLVEILLLFVIFEGCQKKIITKK